MEEKKTNNEISERKYEKPATKKHESLNIVQGSGLYYGGSNYSGYSSGYSYSYVSLYYYY